MLRLQYMTAEQVDYTGSVSLISIRVSKSRKTIRPMAREW
jgi:hypothetical protein